MIFYSIKSNDDRQKYYTNLYITVLPFIFMVINELIFKYDLKKKKKHAIKMTGD